MVVFMKALSFRAHIPGGAARLIEFPYRQRLSWVTCTNLTLATLSYGVIIYTLIHDETYGPSVPKYLTAVSVLSFVTGIVTHELSKGFVKGLSEVEAIVVMGIMASLTILHTITFVLTGVFLRKIVKEGQTEGTPYYFYFHYNRWISNSLLYIITIQAASLCVLAFYTVASVTRILLDQMNNGTKAYAAKKES
eukprot:Blabericola_migrator_1__4876@NODE_2550_length_2619_cov_82_736285_g297_i1_p2_GENE_NODE_2550_length_2619_cov_82_736285_g297_i1NODE_2550_length_2619_cov_82_736285_g297_i1_p2_ORF_typecomplete_len193_score23_22PLAT/PF01477_23/0_28MARVEL/PF01284_23/1_1e02MARVEL/PF01284_23/0_18_NODE_2550_length_2619_cov_82_736285_g297_i114091987